MVGVRRLEPVFKLRRDGFAVEPGAEHNQHVLVVRDCVVPAVKRGEKHEREQQRIGGAQQAERPFPLFQRLVKHARKQQDRTQQRGQQQSRCQTHEEGEDRGVQQDEHAGSRKRSRAGRQALHPYSFPSIQFTNRTGSSPERANSSLYPAPTVNSGLGRRFIAAR